MAKKKDLGSTAEQAEQNGPRLLDETRNKTKRLTFDVSGAEHIAFKTEASNLGLTMQQYFYRLWKGKQ